jgi:hypothetical protein
MNTHKSDYCPILFFVWRRACFFFFFDFLYKVYTLGYFSFELSFLAGGGGGFFSNISSRVAIPGWVIFGVCFGFPLS